MVLIENSEIFTVWASSDVTQLKCVTWCGQHPSKGMDKLTAIYRHLSHFCLLKKIQLLPFRVDFLLFQFSCVMPTILQVQAIFHALLSFCSPLISPTSKVVNESQGTISNCLRCAGCNGIHPLSLVIWQWQLDASIYLFLSASPLTVNKLPNR